MRNKAKYVIEVQKVLEEVHLRCLLRVLNGQGLDFYTYTAEELCADGLLDAVDPSGEGTGFALTARGRAVIDRYATARTVYVLRGDFPPETSVNTPYLGGLLG